MQGKKELGKELLKIIKILYSTSMTTLIFVKVLKVLILIMKEDSDQLWENVFAHFLSVILQISFNGNNFKN